MLASHCFTWVCRKLLRRGPKSNERRFEVMRIQTFVIGSVLALALFLFAQPRPRTAQPGGFREVVDLTHSVPTLRGSPPIDCKTWPRPGVLFGLRPGQRRNNLPPEWMPRLVWRTACVRWTRFPLAA